MGLCGLKIVEECQLCFLYFFFFYQCFAPGANLFVKLNTMGRLYPCISSQNTRSDNWKLEIIGEITVKSQLKKGML